MKEGLGEVETEVIGKPDRKKPVVPCDQSNFDLTIRFLKVALTTSRGGFRKRGVLGHLTVWGPTAGVIYLVTCFKAQKYAPLMCIAPSKLHLFAGKILVLGLP